MFLSTPLLLPAIANTESTSIIPHLCTPSCSWLHPSTSSSFSPSAPPSMSQPNRESAPLSNGHIWFHCITHHHSMEKTGGLIIQIGLYKDVVAAAVVVVFIFGIHCCHGLIPALPDLPAWLSWLPLAWLAWGGLIVKKIARRTTTQFHLIFEVLGLVMWMRVNDSEVVIKLLRC